METMMQTQNRLQSTSENAYPVNTIEDSTLSTRARPEKLVNVGSVSMGSPWREALSSDSIVAGDPDVADLPMAGGDFAVTHSPVAAFASSNAIAPYHKISPLGTHDHSNTMHQQCLSNQSNVHHGTTDTEASVLAPQMV
jgi:hypothetical protein